MKTVGMMVRVLEKIEPEWKGASAIATVNWKQSVSCCQEPCEHKLIKWKQAWDKQPIRRSVKGRRRNWLWLWIKPRPGVSVLHPSAQITAASPTHSN